MERDFKSDHRAFTRRLGKIYRGRVAKSLKEPLRELYAQFEQAIADHKALRGSDASTGYGSEFTAADALLNFFVSAMVKGYEP